MQMSISHHRLGALLARCAPHPLLALGARLSLAGIFYLSARTKVDGWFALSEGTVALFEQEYRLPLIDATFAAHLTTVAEHAIALMLLLGLGTRLASMAVLAMTLVIEVLVYPAAWPTHLSWATLALYLVSRGGGPFALDHWLARPAH